jgi:hydrogenase nickel incorporation protein HypA/HybF
LPVSLPGIHFDKREGTIHESGIAANIIEIAEKAARENSLSCVKEVNVEIGAFAGVEPNLLQFAFSILKKKTLLAESDLIIITPPLLLYCKNCETEYLGDVEDLRCPACLGNDFEVKQGRELQVKSISGG